jgi:hypothetical protein
MNEINLLIPRQGQKNVDRPFIPAKTEDKARPVGPVIRRCWLFVFFKRRAVVRIQSVLS